MSFRAVLEGVLQLKVSLFYGADKLNDDTNPNPSSDYMAIDTGFNMQNYMPPLAYEASIYYIPLSIGIHL